MHESSPKHLLLGKNKKTQDQPNSQNVHDIRTGRDTDSTKID